MLECWARSFHSFLFVGLSEAFEGTQTEVEECRSWHAVVAEIAARPRVSWVGLVEEKQPETKKSLAVHLSARRDNTHQ